MGRRTARRGVVLELAVLGLLSEYPMHGYELRKRLNAALGVFRALSYGTLYPCLRDLLDQDLITETVPHRRRSGRLAADAVTAAVAPGGTSSRRARIVYRLTASGERRLEQLLSDASPAAWEDDSFDVRFAFFARTEAAVRLRILEGRRTRLEERLDSVRASGGPDPATTELDPYATELRRHGLESAEREVRWLTDLIDTERARVHSRG
ncbi:MAG TPA: PadR family transcriptional regulator [Dermatophilaceae bacterium]|nr:PadR family transcriptional regulator [Dermatophilaceae bacterium]